MAYRFRVRLPKGPRAAKFSGPKTPKIPGMTKAGAFKPEGAWQPGDPRPRRPLMPKIK